MNTTTLVGFLNWQPTVENTENIWLKLVCELTLNIGLGIYIHRVVERNNNYCCSGTGYLKCINIFFGLYHPNY